MINHPEYLGKSLGGRHVDYPEGLAQAGQSLNQVFDPKEAERQKIQAMKAMRLNEFTEIARNLEYMRVRLIELDIHDGAACLDQVIRDLILRWDTERNGRL